jgi:hypothetical protein
VTPAADVDTDVDTRGGVVVEVAGVLVAGFPLAGGVVGVDGAAGCEVCGWEVDGAAVEPSVPVGADPPLLESDPAAGCELPVDRVVPSPAL